MQFNCKCGNSSIYLVKKGSTMVGAYCMDCGAWIKWVGKKDIANLERQGFAVQREGYVSPTVKIKQEQLARDTELLAQVTGNVNEQVTAKSVENVEIQLSCKKCGEQSVEDIYVRKVGSSHTGVYCKCCNSWIKWLGKKEINHLTNLGVEMDSPVGIKSQPQVDRSVPKPSTEDLLNGITAKMGEDDVDDLFEEDDEYEHEDDYDYGDEYEDEDSNSEEVEVTVVRENCNFCNGNSELIPITESKVQLTYFGGVLSIIDESGTNLLGSYKLPICPCCGRDLTKR